MTHRHAAAFFALATFSTVSAAKTPVAQPRVSKAAATQTALAAVPNGKVESAELETEHRQLIYSFDISVPGRSGVEEVQVSAMTGRIVSRKHEGPIKENLEKAAERVEGH
jgi:uncharacterized membrane protein YkoI